MTSTVGNTTAGPKAIHYNVSLAAALLKGGWGDDRAGTAPNGRDLSWGEVIRKWGKHTGGNTDLIHRLRDISLLYLSSHHPSGSLSVVDQPAVSSTSAGPPRVGTSNSSEETTASSSSFIHVPHPHLRRHRSRLSEDTAGPGSSTARAQTGSGSKRSVYLSAGDLDGDDSPDGTGWGVGSAWWSGVGQENIEEVREGVKALEGLIHGGKLNAGELQSAQLTLGYHLHALGSHEAAITAFRSVSDSDPKIGSVPGDAGVLERIRARYLQGMSAELQQNPDFQSALKSYLSITHLISALSFSSPVPPYLALQPASTPKIQFEPYREFYRFFAIALSRAAIISARIPNNNTQTLRILRTYHAYSVFWPASFRPLQRQRMLQLYIRALFTAYPRANTSPTSPYTLDPSIPTPTISARALWRKEAGEAIKVGRTLLATTTSFPRAGAVNLPVTQFCDLIVALADRCSTLQNEVIETLWWAMTLTFQSQSILRHLTRLQTSQGQVKPAQRAFELYVQLVLKARETQQPSSTLHLAPRSKEDAATTKVSEDVVTGESGGGQAQADFELDSDEEFIGALLVGSKLLLKELRKPDEAWRYVSLAGDVVQEALSAKRTVSSAMRADVEALKGIIRMTMGARGSDPITRPKYQAQAIDHLKLSVELNDTSASSFYQLAFCQAEARSIEPALISIRQSLELDSRNIQAWHLLALILTANRDWDGAAKAGEAGVSIWEQDEESAALEEEVTVDPAIAPRDFAAVQESVIENEPLLLPSGNFNPPRIDFRPPKSALTRAKRLQNVINLRMTLNVITERTLGTEIAMLRQQELFAFFSARSGKNRYASSGAQGTSTTANSFSGGPERDLGGSYIDIKVDAVSRPASVPSVPSVQPPTPIVESGSSLNAAPVLGRPISSPIVSAHASPIGSSATSETDSPDEAATEREKADNKRLHATKRLMAKHLKVPKHGGLGKGSRPSSVRRLHLPEDLRENVQKSRTASASSAALSIAPTAVHSHYHSAHPTPPPPPPAQHAPSSDHTPAELRILSNLWLMSAATFRRWGKPEQCLVAIEEAEVLDPENPDVWVQLGLYHMASIPPNTTQALPAFTKSMLLKPDHPPGLVNLSKLYIATGQTELAHSLLNQMTQASGWDVPEAWYYLGKVCETQGRIERSRECWVYALELEETRSARSWEDAVDRC